MTQKKGGEQKVGGREPAGLCISPGSLRSETRDYDKAGFLSVTDGEVLSVSVFIFKRSRPKAC